MFDLLAQATAIKARMAGIQGLNQIDYAELFSNLDDKPRLLPSASVLPPEGKPDNPKNKIITATNQWMVVIAAKSIGGSVGHMQLMDNVMDALSGYQPPGAIVPMVPVSWGLLSERISDNIFLSHVTFKTEQRAPIVWEVQQH